MASPRQAPISIVVATFDAAGVLRRCIDSVLGQDHDEVDLVIIDGGSTDGTLDLIHDASAELGAWISEPDTGVYDAWNKGIQRMRGDWVCFLGADDRLAGPDSLSRISPYLADRPERIVYGRTDVVDEGGSLMFSMGEPWADARPALAQRMSLPNPSTFYHRSVFEDHGVFDTRFKIAGDYEMLLRELRNADAFFASDVLVTIMGAGGLSQEPRNRPLSVREAAIARRMNGVPSRPLRWSYDAYDAYLHAAVYRVLPGRLTWPAWRLYHGLRRRLLSVVGR